MKGTFLMRGCKACCSNGCSRCANVCPGCGCACSNCNCCPCPPRPAEYSVTYFSNEGFGGNTDAGLVAGCLYVIKDAADMGIFNPGMAFMNWNTQADGSGITYQVGQSVVVNADLVLYAQWASMTIQNYIVSYHYNPPIGADIVYQTSPIPFNSAHTILPYISTRLPEYGNGYFFAGWYLTPLGTGMNYPIGDSFVFNTDVSLYANWQLLEV